MRATTKGASVREAEESVGTFAEQICFCGKFDRVNATSRGTLSFINLSLSSPALPPVALTFRIPLDSRADSRRMIPIRI